MVACGIWDAEVVSSSLATPTKKRVTNVSDVKTGKGLAKSTPMIMKPSVVKRLARTVSLLLTSSSSVGRIRGLGPRGRGFESLLFDKGKVLVLWVVADAHIEHGRNPFLFYGDCSRLSGVRPDCESGISKETPWVQIPPFTPMTRLV